MTVFRDITFLAAGPAGELDRSAGEVSVREIADDDLTLADVPPADADWGTIGEFALTYNGYKAWGSFEACADIANAQRHGSLAELRNCLFFEQRRWRHYGDEPDDEAMAYIRGVVEQIRQHVGTRQYRHAEPLSFPSDMNENENSESA